MFVDLDTVSNQVKSQLSQAGFNLFKRQGGAKRTRPYFVTKDPSKSSPNLYKICLIVPATCSPTGTIKTRVFSFSTKEDRDDAFSNLRRNPVWKDYDFF